MEAERKQCASTLYPFFILLLPHCFQVPTLPWHFSLSVQIPCILLGVNEQWCRKGEGLWCATNTILWSAAENLSWEQKWNRRNEFSKYLAQSLGMKVRWGWGLSSLVLRKLFVCFSHASLALQGHSQEVFASTWWWLPPTPSRNLRQNSSLWIRMV